MALVITDEFLDVLSGLFDGPQEVLWILVKGLLGPRVHFPEIQNDVLFHSLPLCRIEIV